MLYLNAYQPYLVKREQAVLSLPVIIENSEYRLLYSKKPTDSLYTKMIVLYNNSRDVVEDREEVLRCVYAIHGLSLYREPESQFILDVKLGNPNLRTEEIEALKTLVTEKEQFNEREREVLQQQLDYHKDLKAVGKPLSEVSQKLLDYKKQVESLDKVTEEQLFHAIELAEERTKQRDEMERLLFSNGEYIRPHALKLFNKHKRTIRTLVGRKMYRNLRKEMTSAERNSPRIIRETNRIQGTKMHTKKDYLAFLEKKKTVKERFEEQSQDIVKRAWILSPDYAF
ncbi:hypothetical protein [Geomicrobium sp. JCM 19055]|uniref:hypothetical protein n=1 Tax=Geomicrobium sp. JCM 19055 TaxID=1460649 RepID=UPI00045ED3B8|nr:hypothetical protein [Geomicrobium sp. JCM 19055]GAJ98821.1 hypothetical protein JCM19055_1777 [Geomicrobium sp. JCM 19055]